VEFRLLKKAVSGQARLGEIRTNHNRFETPVFMPVGTLGAIKGISPEELRDIGVDIILSNTYHLYLRPGHERIKRHGGLHRFMNWSGSILTDSGGFQTLSLAKLRTISDDGVTFQSHIDGSKHFWIRKRPWRYRRRLGLI